jgi:hypothetical protein
MERKRNLEVLDPPNTSHETTSAFMVHIIYHPYQTSQAVDQEPQKCLVFTLSFRLHIKRNIWLSEPAGTLRPSQSEDSNTWEDLRSRTRYPWLRPCWQVNMNIYDEKRTTANKKSESEVIWTALGVNKDE